MRSLERSEPSLQQRERFARNTSSGLTNCCSAA